MMRTPGISGRGLAWTSAFFMLALPVGCGDDGDPDDDGSTGTDGSTTSTSTSGGTTWATSGGGPTTSLTGDSTQGTTDGTEGTTDDTAGTTDDTDVPATDSAGETETETGVVPGETGTTGDDTDGATDSTTGGDVDIVCDAENGSLVLPNGFCATVFADGLGTARHLTVTPSGDVFVAIAGAGGGVVALRDANGDGIADEQQSFGSEGGNGIAWAENTLYVALNDRIERYTLADGELVPSSEPEVVVGALPSSPDHYAKTVVVAGDTLYVNIGSATNSCQEQNRVLESPGIDPCEELEIRAGIWQFDGTTTGQTQADGSRYAQGTRNANAMAWDPASETLWAALNGRDQLWENWPEFYTEEDDTRLPAERIIHVTEGGDYGWPYCYYDPELAQMVLAPEYGGDGTSVAEGDHDCSTIPEPEGVLPAHWAPLGMVFYHGEQFPERYRGGMFVANHGSRFAEQAQDPPGYNVVFVPFADGQIAGEWEAFATDFAGDARPLPGAAEYRPVGLAEAPDGSIYISDDTSGRIWRVFYTGTGA